VHLAERDRGGLVAGSRHAARISKRPPPLIAACLKEHDVLQQVLTTRAGVRR
jgi:hypothetical protein